MTPADELLLRYLHLAEASQLRRQPLVRDKLLVLAAVTASELGWNDVAADCRAEVLSHNPRHLLRRWPDVGRARRAERFLTYLKQVRRKYSPEKVEHLLQSLAVSVPAVADLESAHDRAAELVGQVAQTANDQSASATPDEGPRGAVRGLDREIWWPFWFGLIALALVAMIELLR